MSVTSTELVSEQAGNDVKVAFDFSFKIFAETDLVVRKKAADGTYGDPLVLNDDYTVEFDTAAETGTVTFAVAPVTDGAAVIARATSPVQGTVFPRESPMPEKNIENAVDKLTLMVQELEEMVERAPLQPQFPVHPDSISIDPPSDTKALKYQDNGDGTWTIIPSTYDPDEAQLDAAESAVAAAASADAAAASAAAAEAAADRAESAAGAATLDYQVGLFSARPAAPADPTFYYSTDRDSLEFWVPSASHWFLIG